MSERPGLTIGLLGWLALGLAFLVAWAGAVSVGVVLFFAPWLLAPVGAIVSIVGLMRGRPGAWAGLAVSVALLAFVIFLVWAILDALSRLE